MVIQDFLTWGAIDPTLKVVLAVGAYLIYDRSKSEFIQNTSSLIGFVLILSAILEFLLLS